MDSKMKAGLFGTFVVIVVIVSVIGTLPNKLPFLQGGEENEQDQSLMSPQADPPGLKGTERHTQQYMEQLQRAVEQELTTNNRQNAPDENSNVNAEVRIVLPLPESPGPVIGPVEVAESQEQNPQPLPEPVWPKAYVVEAGDNLALIAKHFYGPVEGNRMGTIERLFAANRRVLQTRDQLRVGQRLVIPHLNPLASKALGAVTVPAKSIGGSGLNRTQGTQSRRRPRDRWYVVRDGDSLWKIASAKLGNGRLYSEIAKLNSAIIEDEDDLPVGLRLRLPVL